ncbi:MAG: Zn-ribbon domain-containing OB-fold protein [Candidatus Hodarchaeota archaeon]
MYKEEKIEWNKCKNCGYIQHKSHLRCLNCKSKEFLLMEASGDCKLLTFTVLKAPPAEFRSKDSYTLGIIEFENGIKALGQITTQENLEFGMKLRPVYKKICDNLDGKEVFSYVFEPV